MKKPLEILSLIHNALVGKVKNAIKLFMKRWHEYIPVVVALLVWLVIGPVIRLFSPTAGTDDAGLLQALVFGLVLYFAACAFSWFALRTIFPSIGRFVDDDIDWSLSSTDLNTRIWASIAIFAVYFLGAIVMLASAI